MRDDFAAFVLTHGRPDRVLTMTMLQKGNYSGKTYLLVDDQDATLSQYQEKYGDQVIVFNKAEVEKNFDIGDNFLKAPGSVVHARNACYMVAKELGLKYFVQLDDDYTDIQHAITRDNRYLTDHPRMQNLDASFEAMVRFLEDVPYCATIAYAQSGDFIGGTSSAVACRLLSRKAMNSFFCATDRPVEFRGRINEDVNVYTADTRRGVLLLTFPKVRVQQMITQSGSAGMTDIYLDVGTYVKSFYTMLYAPGCTRVSTMGTAHPRIHHRVDWNAAAPLILREKHRKPRKLAAQEA